MNPEPNPEFPENSAGSSAVPLDPPQNKRLFQQADWFASLF
jgi:hypothetical protein